MNMIAESLPNMTDDIREGASAPRRLQPPSFLRELHNPSGLRLQFADDGGLFAIRHGRTLINQALPLLAGDGLMRLACRVRGKRADRRVIPLVNSAVPSAGAANTFIWRGEAGELSHEVSVLLHPEKSWWVWRVRLENRGMEPVRADVIYGQDLGLADEAAVRNNEAYVSQYIDHRPAAHPVLGTVLLSRQNQRQSNGAFPWIMQGCTDGVAWGTDGFQFFGVGHRLTGRPAIWDAERLPSRVRQYEMAYAALQSREFEISPGGQAEVAFFACFVENHPAASAPEDIEALAPALVEFLAARPGAAFGGFRAGASALPASAPLLAGRELDEGELRGIFPGPWRHVERRDRTLLSFFYGAHGHAVMGAKEEIVERSHGHILRSGGALWPEASVAGTTVWAGGVFSAGVYLGNTNISRFLGVVRDPLNVLRASGQRIFVRGKEGWGQLGVPSVFAMDLEGARWIYRLDEGTVEVRVECAAEAPRIILGITVTGGPRCAFLISHAVTFAADELTAPGSITFGPANGCVVCSRDDGEAWRLTLDGPLERLGGDELLYPDGRSRGAPFVVFETAPLERATLTLEPFGRDDSGAAREELPLAGLRLLHPAIAAVERVSDALPWFAHDAMIHLAAPHGLEQYSGAAWGTRDVCQGPVEWLLAAGRVGEVRRILLEVFSRQYAGTGGWPQWFMHEPYERIQQAHSHGDLPFWPLKALCDYVEASNDFGILDEETGYTDAETLVKCGPSEPLSAHVARVIGHWRSRLLPGTTLVDYGDGDWDDTLQPADVSLRSSLVSSWTVGLAFHAFRLWGQLCRRAGRTRPATEAEELCEAIMRDFRSHLVIDGVVAGFALAGGHTLRPLLHPRDKVTGIRYRLLPMTRGILSELFDPDEAAHHAGIVREFLLFPDGARLMSDPVPYAGGVEKIFRRAETAANFGREIGLQYVHAHIRYAEAMAKLGDADALWRALQVVNPVGIRESVPHAAPRQANAYFSSSDGDFSDRYEAGSGFEGLRDGSVSVRGGWRIYSSGAGLYLHKVMTCLLGWQESFGDLVLDPVLPPELDGLEARFDWKGARILVRYRVTEGVHTPRSVRINGHPVETRPEPNPYRPGGVRMTLPVWAAGENLVEIAI